jgi:V8-like Glu-specific endopeptidase
MNKSKTKPGFNESLGEPMSFLDQAKEEPRYGAPDWFNQRRKAFPPFALREVANCTALPRELIKKGGKISNIESFTPEESPIISGEPAATTPTEPKVLKRFSGKKVLPAEEQHRHIFDGENRKLFQDPSYPFVCVGQIITPSKKGTAALVGRSIILTAAHIVSGLWSHGHPAAGNIFFVPAMDKNHSILGSDWVAKVIAIAAYEDVDEECGYDMAICLLDKPMGEWLGYFGATVYDEVWEDMEMWMHVGYPWDLSPTGAQPCYENRIAVRDHDNDTYGTMEIETRSDTAEGQSGGPLWTRFPQGRYIIGTLSGVETNLGEPTCTVFAGGYGLTTLIQWGRDNWG